MGARLDSQRGLGGSAPPRLDRISLLTNREDAETLRLRKRKLGRYQVFPASKRELWMLHGSVRNFIVSDKKSSN
jgi:hypothetical protein